MDNNKNQPHLLPLNKRTRNELRDLILAKIPDNLQKQIRARDVREVCEALTDSVINWQDDNVDLRQYGQERFLISEMTLTAGTYRRTLAQTPVNPEHGTMVFVDGLRLDYTVDFTIESGNELMILQDSEVDITGIEVLVLYRFY